MRQNQRGNILFLILLAIVLFVALSYAITNQRDGGKNASGESAKSLASFLLQHGSLVENTVMRMTTVGGIRPEALDFRFVGISDAGLTANAACLSTACKVFDPAGGGATPRPTPKAAMGDTDAGKTAEGEARYNVILGEIKNLGTSQPEIILLMRGLKAEVCDAINIAEDIYTSTNRLIPTDGVSTPGTDYISYESTNTDPWPTLSATAFGSDTRLFGRRAFCFRQNVSAGYYMAYVLYSR